MRDDPYNRQVRASFENPVHTGAVTAGYPLLVAASAAESGTGARLSLSAGIEDGKIAAIRFRAWGCPHLIAAAETSCAALEGQPVSALGYLRASRLMEKLAVPAVKTGRMMLLEDAAASLLEQAG